MLDTLRDYKKIVVYVIVITFIAGSGLMGYGALFTDDAREVQDEEEYEARVLANVNEGRITRDEFSNAVSNQVQQFQMYQGELTSSQYIELRYNVLDFLVERELKLQEAQNRGLVADIGDEEIDEEIDSILQQHQISDEELSNILGQQQISMEQFRQHLRTSLEQENMIEQLENMVIETEDITVSEEEIEHEYQLRYTDEDSDQKLEDVREDIEQELMDQKEREAINDWLDNLKDEAEIEVRDAELRGMLALNNENYEQAVMSLEQALDASPTTGIYVYLAQAYKEDGQLEEAKNIYEQGLNENPDNWELHLNFAQLYNELDENENAVEQLDKAAELIDDEFGRVYQLYMGYEQAGAEEKAEEQMQKLEQIQQEFETTPAPQPHEDFEGDMEDLEEEFEEERLGEQD